MDVQFAFGGSPRAVEILVERLDAATGVAELLVAALIAYLEVTRALDMGARLDEVERSLQGRADEGDCLARGA
jgi:hypothetical protein